MEARSSTPKRHLQGRAGAKLERGGVVLNLGKYRYGLGQTRPGFKDGGLPLVLLPDFPAPPQIMSCIKIRPRPFFRDENRRSPMDW